MAFKYDDYVYSKKIIARRLQGFVPEVLITLGSGLGFMADEVEDPLYVPYDEIPNFKTCTAPDHKGRFVFGKLCGKNVAVMQGRLHCYEGYTMEEVTYPYRTIRLLGTEKLILTNAAGCVNMNWHVGELMLIGDHIRLFGNGPLQGENIPEFGPRFCDMSYVYSQRLQDLAESKARKLDMPLRKGVYMFFPGPNFETPAEVRAARALGADAVGMSTVPEVIVAHHCGIRTFGISVITDLGGFDVPVEVSHEEVQQAANKAQPLMTTIMREMIIRNESIEHSKTEKFNTDHPTDIFKK
jgi:purine-nucleoside phosphorylase